MPSGSEIATAPAMSKLSVKELAALIETLPIVPDDYYNDRLLRSKFNKFRNMG
jgi:hypothetical protein